jgi:dTDP-4-amino-4,6-dideoxygalactose transaminase
MIIPFLSLKDVNLENSQKFKDAFEVFLNTGTYILGENVRKFEKNFAAYCQQKYCIGLANGLDALILGIEAFNFEQGSEIIVPANTYFASILAIYRAGCKPVLVEPSLLDYLIDCTKIEEAVTPKTKAILAVNLYGKMCDFNSLSQICKKHKLKLIVDAAQSHGAIYNRGKTCSGADIVAYSFYPTKNLGALADGGALLCEDLDIYENIKSKRNYGSLEKYIFEEKGINSRLSELQAAFLNIKLEKLDKDLQYRKWLAKFYMNNLSNEKIILPFSKSEHEDSYHLFIIRTKERKNFTNYLSENGIGYEIHYPIPPHKQNAFKELNHLSLPITEEIHNTILSLPLNTGLGEAQISYIVDVINKY